MFVGGGVVNAVKVCKWTLILIFVSAITTSWETIQRTLLGDVAFREHPDSIIISEREKPNFDNLLNLKVGAHVLLNTIYKKDGLNKAI